MHLYTDSAEIVMGAHSADRADTADMSAHSANSAHSEKRGAHSFTHYITAQMGDDESGSGTGDDQFDTDNEQDVGLATATAKPKLKRPPMYKVILLNDDYTPMEFVVHILEKFFGMNREKATQIMLTVHTEGAATVGIFPRDIAETKSELVNLYAQENNHPLMSKVEMTD